MAREQEKLSKDVLAVLDKKTNDLRLVSEMNEQTGEFIIKRTNVSIYFEYPNLISTSLLISIFGEAKIMLIAEARSQTI